MNETKKVSRRKYTAEFRAKVALEAMQENQTLPELCSKYQLSPNQVNQWKKRLRERSVKQEYVYENPCRIFDFYNNRRLHQSLGYQCHATVYMKKRVV